MLCTYYLKQKRQKHLGVWGGCSASPWKFLLILPLWPSCLGERILCDLKWSSLLSSFLATLNLAIKSTMPHRGFLRFCQCRQHAHPSNKWCLVRSPNGLRPLSLATSHMPANSTVLCKDSDALSTCGWIHGGIAITVFKHFYCYCLCSITMFFGPLLLIVK